ncbi:MAG: acyl-CoA desaturase [Cyanobacteria bacterium]|nr:acyl-CoA desaturase [Cyanobacteriota bacterium]
MTVAASQDKLPLDWGVVIFMVVVHSAAIFAFLPSNFSWTAVGVALFLHWLTGGLGITLGWHRLVAHRSFQVPKWLEYLLVFFGALSCQGGPTWWVGLHRHHHKFSDTDPDHHDSTKGFWWSHMGWLLHEVPAETEVKKFTQDIWDDPFYKFLDKYFLVLQFALGGLLYAIGGWPFVVWGMFVRLVAVFHATWFVNSATHKFGYRSHESGDNSRNCWWVALMTYGEGWHNNHHAFQYSARHGLKWWEVDMTWMTIQFLGMLGLAKNIKLPKLEATKAS